MSSGIRNTARGQVELFQNLTEEGVSATLGIDSMSGRQRALDALWRFYNCTTYEDRAIAWDGSRSIGSAERAQVFQQGFLPQGFVDATAATLPLKFRRPDVPYYLAKVIVNRFTGLLFSQNRHPQIQCDDEQTEEWLNGVVTATRLWARMALARAYGGSMGSVCLGFVFKQGKPRVEVHDPRWCSPEFEDREELLLKSLEKRYQYRKETRLPNGKWAALTYWYRRVIDATTDTVWPAVPVKTSKDGGETHEPDWKAEQSITTPHNYGFCPVVWVQNQESQEHIDGDPDCHGTFELIEAIDQLDAQAKRGVLANSDPTLVMSTDREFEEVKKGSDNALLVGKGETAEYLELSGKGPEAASALSDRLEKRVLRITRCVLADNFDGPARTAEEVQANFSSMLEQADMLREQYGEKGVKPLLEMILRAARVLDTPKLRDSEVPEVPYYDQDLDSPTSGSKTFVRNKVLLPRTEDGEERQIGQGEHIELVWPKYYAPSLDKIKAAVEAAGAAKTFNLVDDEHAIRFVAEYFGIEDVMALVEKNEERRAEMELQMGARIGEMASKKVEPETENEDEEDEDEPDDRDQETDTGDADSESDDADTE